MNRSKSAWARAPKRDSRGAIVLALLFAGASVVAADLKVTAEEDVFLFGGRSGVVSVAIQNKGTDKWLGPVEYRLFQASSATMAPVGERLSLGERELPADQGGVVAIKLEPPQVRAITSFVLKIWAGGEELEALRLFVCPTNLFAGLKGAGIEVQEPEPLVGPLLNGAGNEAEKKLSIVRVPNGEFRWQEGRQGPAVLFIVGRGVEGAERLMPLKFKNDGGTRVAILQDWFVPDLKESARSQLRLLRAIDLLLKPEQVRGPKTAN